jgi:hypothetical protein
MNIKKIRDLTLVHLDEERTLVIACDSCGSIGIKSGDVLKVAPFITGRFTARVVIFEVLCAGAKVICLTNTVCNEMEPTGREVQRGIEQELKEAGIDSIVLTGSTEENFPTFSTGVGITALGIAGNADLKLNNIKDEASLLAIGQPKVGQEILTVKPGDIPDYNVIKYLIELNGVYEIVPVGSKGILHEAQELAENNQLKLILNQKIKVNVKKTAGPCTVIIVAVRKDIISKINIINNIEVIGKLIK